MWINIWSTYIKDIRVGNNKVSAVYRWDDKIYPDTLLPVSWANLHLDANRITWILNWAKVATRPDLSWNNNNAVAYSWGWWDFHANSLNWKNGIYFNKSVIYKIPNNVFNGVSTEITIFAVMKVSNEGVSNFIAIPDTAYSRINTHTPHTAQYIYWDFGDIQFENRWRIRKTGFSNTGHQYCTWLAGNNNMKFRSNWVNIVSGNHSSTFTQWDKWLALWWRPALSTTCMDWYFYEFIIYPRRLSDTEVLEIETYLKTKYWL